MYIKSWNFHRCFFTEIDVTTTRSSSSSSSRGRFEYSTWVGYFSKK